MDLSLAGPWLVLGGYAGAAALLYLAQWWENRTGLTGKGRAPALFAFSLAAAVAAETTQWWLDWGTSSSIPSTLWWALPAVAAVLGWWFKWRQRTWMSRVVADNRGSYFSDDAETDRERPSFGVLYRRGRPVDSTHPGGGFRAAIEFDRRGYRILGVQYRTTDGSPLDGFDRGEPGAAARAADAVDSTYNLVQVKTPLVPTVMIRARPTVEQHEKFGGLEPREFHPFEDMRITRNTIGAPLPEVPLEDFETGDALFTKRFSVRTTDPAFAQAALNAETRALLTGEPWFRIREVVFHHGSLWTTQSGPLTENKLFDNSAHLTELAATVPADSWRAGSAGAEESPEFTERFLALREIPDGDGHQPAPGPRRTLAAMAKRPVNARRRAADLQPLSSLSLLVRSVLVIAFAAVGISLAVNGFLSVVGLAPRVEFTVDRAGSVSTSTCYSDGSCSSSPEYLVDGHYDRGGSTRDVVDFRWSSWGAKPVRGDVVEVSIGPLPWNPMIEGRDIAAFLTLLGALALTIGYRLARATYFPKRKRSRPRTTATEPTPAS